MHTMVFGLTTMRCGAPGDCSSPCSCSLLTAMPVFVQARSAEKDGRGKQRKHKRKSKSKGKHHKHKSSSKKRKRRRSE